MKKRFLCIMLVLLMASALLPAGAFAAEGGKALRRGADGLIPCIGENGNWWVWDEETGEYRDTGTFARGDTMFATFDIDIKTGSLVCTTPDKYTGPSFSLENGELYVNINE